MKSAEEWSREVLCNVDSDTQCVPLIRRIQADATATLQSQVEQLSESHRLMQVQVRVSDKAFDFHMKRADEAEAQKDKLRTALEKCVVALEECRDVKINMDEFSRWSPDRISAFFSGIAQVLTAKGAIEKEGSQEVPI